MQHEPENAVHPSVTPNEVAPIPRDPNPFDIEPSPVDEGYQEEVELSFEAIMLVRIYDVLMTLLRNKNPMHAQALKEMHESDGEFQSNFVEGQPRNDL